MTTSTAPKTTRVRKTSKATSLPEPRKKGDVDTDEAVYAAIRKAILSGQLSPGLKLRENLISSYLRVSRERVRKALHRLAHERFLEIVPNRGTLVPTPSVEEMHAIYEARKIVEVGIARQVAGRLYSRRDERIMEHVAKEEAAALKNDRALMVKLSAEFHELLAQLTDNDYLIEMFSGLMVRSRLHFSLYAPNDFHNCAGPEEHKDIAGAICEGNAARADKLMQRHLRGLESLLTLRRRSVEYAPLEQVFSPIGGASSAQAEPPRSRARRKSPSSSV